jgi:hypothetical protein
VEPGRIDLILLACRDSLNSIRSLSKGVISLFLATIIGVLPTVSTARISYTHFYSYFFVQLFICLDINGGFFSLMSCDEKY